MKSHSLAVAAVGFVLACAGCQKDRPPDGPPRASRDLERRLVVQTTTRPAGVEGAGVDDGEPQRITVVVDDRSGADPATPSAASLRPFVGRPCRVQIRRDALGLAAPAPLPPLAEGVGGRVAYLDGTLAEADGDGLLVQGERRAFWVPWSSVLLIELDAASDAAR
jgi:hypothetical protein